jgi:hypothetical protein
LLHRLQRCLLKPAWIWNLILRLVEIIASFTFSFPTI